MTTEETETETDFVVSGVSNLIKVVTGINNNCRNVKYNSTTNTTNYYGHSNFEEVKAKGNEVALI